MITDILLKIVVAGDGGVGKTTMLHYYLNEEFLEDTKLTVGVQFFTKTFVIKGRSYKVMFWDVGGQDRFKDLHTSYIGGAMGAIIMFDLSRPLTLFNIGEWINMLRESNEDIPLLLVGAKYDLIQGFTSKIKFKQINKSAMELKEKYSLFDYCITSSKIGYNIDHAFSVLLEKVKDYYSIKSILDKLKGINM